MIKVYIGLTVQYGGETNAALAFNDVSCNIILEWTTSLDTSSRTLYWNGQLVWTPALGLYL